MKTTDVIILSRVKIRKKHRVDNCIIVRSAVYLLVMKFRKVPVETAIQEIATTLIEQLEKHPVLWLVSGGSNVQTQCEILANVRNMSPNLLSRLTVMPMDERYGKSGHKDSNITQLINAGFDMKGGMLVDILADNLPLEVTVSFFHEHYIEKSAAAGWVMGTFGMGADGHTAGILHDSPAVIDTEAVVVGYTAADYPRLTLGPSELVKCDAAYLLCYGAAKHAALEALQHRSDSLILRPANLLHDIERCIVYNDHID